jgi:hypothetical protein
MGNDMLWFGYEVMAEEVVAGEKEKRTESATFPGMSVARNLDSGRK